MVLHCFALSMIRLAFAAHMPFCAPVVEATPATVEARMSELWEEPNDVGTRDMFNGPWGAAHAPDPHSRVHRSSDRNRVA